MGFPLWRGDIAFEEMTSKATRNHRKYDDDFKQARLRWWWPGSRWRRWPARRGSTMARRAIDVPRLAGMPVRAMASCRSRSGAELARLRNVNTELRAWAVPPTAMRAPAGEEMPVREGPAVVGRRP
jgi:hypothetical protein